MLECYCSFNYNSQLLHTSCPCSTGFQCSSPRPPPPVSLSLSTGHLYALFILRFLFFFQVTLFVVVIVFIYTSFSTFYLTCMLLKSELSLPPGFLFSNTNISSNFCHTTSKRGGGGWGLFVCCHHFPPLIRGSFCLSYHLPLFKNSS